jgi:hypothetical protein
MAWSACCEEKAVEDDRNVLVVEVRVATEVVVPASRVVKASWPEKKASIAQARVLLKEPYWQMYIRIRYLLMGCN